MAKHQMNGHRMCMVVEKRCCIMFCEGGGWTRSNLAFKIEIHVF